MGGREERQVIRLYYYNQSEEVVAQSCLCDPMDWSLLGLVTPGARVIFENADLIVLREQLQMRTGPCPAQRCLGCLSPTPPAPQAMALAFLTPTMPSLRRAFACALPCNPRRLVYLFLLKSQLKYHFLTPSLGQALVVL